MEPKLAKTIILEPAGAQLRSTLKSDDGEEAEIYHAAPVNLELVEGSGDLLYRLVVPEEPDVVAHRFYYCR